MTVQNQRISVALVNDYELVVLGLSRMLQAHSDRIQLVELDVRAPVAHTVDVALCDTFAHVEGTAPHVREILSNDAVDRVVLYTWNLDPTAIESALSLGVHGYLAKSLSADELVRDIERVHGGERVVSTSALEAQPHVRVGDWPGRDAGLSGREAEIVCLITRGLSNKHIAEQTFLSINSVKSCIRTAYRRMGVTSRSQAVLWGVQHGMAPERPARLVAR